MDDFWNNKCLDFFFSAFLANFRHAFFTSFDRNKNLQFQFRLLFLLYTHDFHEFLHERSHFSTVRVQIHDQRYEISLVQKSAKSERKTLQKVSLLVYFFQIKYSKKYVSVYLSSIQRNIELNTSCASSLC